MKRVWPVLLASGLGLALLLWLGFWQVERLAWKNALIEKIDQRINDNGMPLADTLMALGRKEDLDYQRVWSFDGKCIKGAYIRLLTSHEGLPAYRIFQACEYLNSGAALIVDMGALPEVLGNAWENHAYGFIYADEPDRFVMDVNGVLRQLTTRRAYFDPENNPEKNLWYWWDGNAVFQALKAKLPKDMDLTNVVIQQTQGGNPQTWPRPVPPKANLKNNHLGYAITWFGLAAVLVVMTGLFIYRSRHSGESRNLSNP